MAWITLLIQQKGSRTSDVKMPKRVADAHKAEKEKKKKNAGWGGGNDAGSNEANLIGNDVLQTFENLRWTSQMPSCIVGLISGMAVLIHILGAAPALCGLSVMFLCLFFVQYLQISLDFPLNFTCFVDLLCLDISYLQRKQVSFCLNLL